MRVLILAQSFEPAHGGGPRWITELAHGLAERGHNVRVLTKQFPGYDGTREPKPNLTIKHLPLFLVRGSPIFTRRLLDEEIRSFEPDVIQTSAPSLTDLLMPNAKRYRAPYVTMFHAQLGASLPAKAVQGLNIYRLRRGEWKKIVVSTDYWKRWLVDRGVSGSSLEEIPPTVSRIFASGPVPGVRRERGHLLFVGGLASVQSYKRFDLLLEACSEVLTQAPELDWHLSVVGDGNLRAGYEREAVARGLDKHVRFLGPIDDERLHLLYSQATRMVLASSDVREGWGVVLAEALCCGCPILLTDGIGGTSTFSKAPGALVAPAGDAGGIARMLVVALRQEPDGLDAERERFGSRFHADRGVEAFEELYAKCQAS